MPLVRSKVLCEKHDLTNVVSVMSQLTIDRLNDRVLFATYRHLPFTIFGAQRLQRGKYSLPTALPINHEVILGGLRLDHKLQIAIAVGLLAIGVQKVSPA